MKDTDFILMNLGTMRIYLQQNQTIPAETFWQKLFPQNVSTAILKAAVRAGIGQAILYPVKAGFLQGSVLVFDQSEVPPIRLPVCLELVGLPEQLKRFIDDHQHLLKHTRIILETSRSYEALPKFK
ncbi:MAG: hypothetical protein BGO21_07715 [Dyadobacter sp. 50-39]|uniref:DUF190 domain-containing protein n=1 Tax=Dyadobacter sp. 50-39 TaxID=1895756 RepID=UPI0009691105|nr:DUF190 domain-containing protein [Dyadobacter sp. 50-39]OJV19373.1 MAG: hypothetical protein BGO21_07715 [Dyadobacter sp. 50-39]